MGPLRYTVYRIFYPMIKELSKSTNNKKYTRRIENLFRFFRRLKTRYIFILACNYFITFTYVRFE